MKAGKHLQTGAVGAVLFAAAALAGAPVAFDAGVIRNAPDLEPKPFAVEDGGSAAPLRLAVNAGAKKFVPGDRNAVELPYVAVPDGNGRGIEVSWDPSKSRYIEVLFNRPLALPEFNKVTVNAKFYAPAGCPVRNIGLRLGDASNEIFQYSKALNFTAGGVIEANWTVTPGEWKNSWGGNADHQFDQPGKVRGFGVDYAPAGTSAKFYLLSLTAEVSGGAAQNATRTLYSFDLANVFRKNWGTGTLSLGESGLSVGDIRGETAIAERKGELVFFNSRPTRIQLDAQLNAGQVKAYWVFRDAAGKELRSPELALKNGKNVLNFNLAELMKNVRLPIRVERLALVNSGSAPGSVVLTDSRMSVAQPLAEAVDFEVQTGNGIGVLKTGMENALMLNFTNTAGEAGEFAIDVTFRHFSGKTARESFRTALKPGESRSLSPKFRPDLLGHWDVETTVRTAGASNRTVRSFAYLRPAGPTPGLAPGFLFSICTHSGRWSIMEQLLEAEAAATCGAKVIRDSIEWGSLQPERDVWNWERMDFLVNLYEALGIEHQALFAFTAKWAAPLEAQQSGNWLDWNRCAPDLDAWRTYVRTMAERYRGRIRYWEVWNEPDLSGFNRMSLDEYVALQKATFEEVKKVAPESVVMTGGFATLSDHPGKKSPTFHRDYLNLAKGSFDVHAYHEHGSFARFAQLVDGIFVPMRKETGTAVPWYANETAINSMNGSERNQALTLFKKLLFAWSRGAIGYTWYDLRNDGFDPLDGEHNYGMLTNDFQPKPVYSVYNMLAGLYREMNYVKQLELGDNRWGFVFADGRDILIPAWDESGFGSAMALAVRTDAKSAAAIDLMGNETPVALLDGMVLLEVTSLPYTLKLAGARSAEPAGALLELAAGGAAVPGRTFRFSLNVFNPLKHDCKFRLELSGLPEGLTAAETVREVEVAAGKNAVVEFTAEAASTPAPEYGSRKELTVGYRLTGTPWAGSMTVPVNTAVAIPAGKDFNRRPDFTLDRREQVVSLTAADPTMSHRVWRDTDDLSAKIHLGKTDGAMHLLVKVTDDRHHQPYSGFEVWKGDNIQFAFQLPGQRGYWEFGLSHLNSGKSEIMPFQAPDGFDGAAAAGKLKLTTTRRGTETCYDLTIPESAVGASAALLKQGIRFNLLVNDNDGEGRDGWIHIAPGIGENKNPDRFPFVLFE